MANQPDTVSQRTHSLHSSNENVFPDKVVVQHDSDNDSEAASEEFYDAIGDNERPETQPELADAEEASALSTTRLTQKANIIQVGPNVKESNQTQMEVNTANADIELTSRPTESVPRPPPRTRKKKVVLKQSVESGISENNGNNSSSAESRSMTNSVESTTTSVAQSLAYAAGHNLTGNLDDIPSMAGNLSLTDLDDLRSVHLEAHSLNKQLALKSTLVKPELLFSNEQFKAISKNLEKQPENKSGETRENLNQIMIMNIDTGEKVPLTKAENLLPECLNPLNLHLMKLTNEFADQEERDKKTNSLDKESTSTNIADSTLKSVTSLISSTLSDKKEKKLDKKLKKRLKETSDEETQSHYEFKEEEEDEDDEKNGTEYKDGRLKARFRDLKKLGTGLIRGVSRVKSVNAKERSTFHVDLKAYSGEPEPPPPPPRYKLKVNHKRGGADFDALKLEQEINDCNGAIWCMKFSNCSQLLAAAGQDHLLRVYCAQKSWKYFTQLRNKASGQHISPNSTKERSSANGDSFGRVQRSSFSRSGSLNASDSNSHNNSSSSSSSSAFAKEMYREEDNTLSEEGPLLLFTIYRGHTGDVLDLAWSNNHFLLSASMDKTVRLWHITRIECLCTFRHIDFVTTIQFHPRDDRYFLSGSLDGKLRLWNIPDKRVTLWNEVNALPVQRGSGGGSSTTETDLSPTHGLITASSFVQNGKFAVIGTYDGRIIFYTTDQLKYFTQLHVSAKSSSSSGPSGTGNSKRVNKVTGIESVDDNNKILVTTNDSRLRLYDLRDLSLTCKYKGCINQSSQIKAAISHDHKYIICGSENNSFYIWRMQDNSTIGQRRDRNKQYECIRLMNPTPPASVASPIFASETANSSVSGTTSNGGPSATTGGSKQSLETEKVLLGKENNLHSTEPENPTSTTVNPSSGTSQTNSSSATNPQTSFSSAATKIVTCAIFAPVPCQIVDKAKYVMAIADFNGYIRIFSKH